MKKFLLLATLSLAVFTASAQTVDVSKMSYAQRAAIAKIVAEPAQGVAAAAATLETIDEVVDRIERVSAGAAKGLVAFAKELGVAANTFANTPLGMLVTAGLVLHFAGSMITSLFVGFIMLFILFPTSAYFTYKLFNRRVVIEEVQTTPVLFGLWQRQVVTKSHEIEAFRTDGDVSRAVVMLIFTVVFLIAGAVTFVQ